LARNLARSMGTRSSAVGRGLAPQESGAGTLISFSTQPGNVALDGMGGRNSPYAGALVKFIATPEEDLPTTLVKVRNDVMQATNKKQVPWEHSALTGQVILTRAAQDDKPTAKPDNTGNAEAALFSGSGESSPSKTKDEECSEEGSIKPFIPLFEKIGQAYQLKFIDSIENNNQKRELIDRMLPVIKRMPPNASCTLIYLREVNSWYKKNWIDILEYNEIKSVLTKKFFAE
jgi:Caspase domain